MERRLIFNIGTLLTMRHTSTGPLRGREMAEGEVLRDAAMLIADNLIAEIGSSQQLLDQHGSTSTLVDARGRMVTPGLVDAHTHLVHAGSREHELTQKLAGIPYLEILALGGGILSTVRATRSASADQLVEQALVSLRRMVTFGVTTVECKSGYGLDLKNERKQLQVVSELRNRQPVKLVSTFLGLHAVPPEFAGQADIYVDHAVSMLPEIRADSLAEFCDVFCEQGVFSIDESRRFLEAARNYGFGTKLHADEMAPLGGAELAAEVGAVSADHLLTASESGLLRMAEAGVIAVVLPGTAWNLGKPPARSRSMIDDYGLAVAIATDFNPGSCPTENLQLMMAFACHLHKLQPAEVFAAVTRNAAHAVNRGRVAGVLDIGRPADIVLWDAPNPDYVVYHFGVNHVDTVWIDGRVVVERGVGVWH